MPAQKVVWADLDDDDLVCEMCEEKETVYPYCVNCVNKHLTLLSLFQPDTWGYSESAKKRFYEELCECRRQELRAQPRHGSPGAVGTLTK